MQEKEYFNLYKTLTSKEFVFVRIILFALLFVVALLLVDNLDLLIRLIPLAFVLLLQELFIHRKLEKMNPEKSVDEAENVYEATSFEARADLESSNSSYQIAKTVSTSKEGKFFLGKIREQIELENLDIEKNELVEKAAFLVKVVNGKYIYPVDLLAAYFILQEQKAKIMEQENLSEQDVATVLYWTRKKKNIGEKDLDRINFYGSGAFDWLVYGWTPETNNYTSDFTKEVLRLNYEPKAVGRGKEYKQIIESLSRNSSSNVLLVGDPGVGRTNLIMDFTYDAYQGTLTKSLKNKRIYFLFVDRLLSGADSRGEIEKRLNSIFTEVSHAGNIIMLIENIENIFGGGGFNFDISGALQPYLTSSNIQIIGTTTPQAYKDFINSKPSIQALFSDINLEEPDEKVATFMIIEEVNIREKMSDVVITYGAIKEIVNSANLYAPELVLPGSAAQLLEDAIVSSFHEGKEVVTANEVKVLINEKTGVNLSTPTKEERKELLEMEDTLHKNLIGQDEAVTAVSNAVRKLRSGMKKDHGPIASFLFLGPTGVGKTTTAKLLSREYFGSDDRLIRLDMSEYQTQESIKKLLGEMPGEKSFSNSFIDQITQNPFSVVLLDEFEKAHSRLLDVFLQILDEGFATNNKGKKISFSNAIIIATSNAGSEFIRERLSTGNEKIKDDLIEYVLQKEIFRPELINRFDDVVVFHPLSEDQILKVVELKLTDLKNRLSKQYIKVSFSDSAIQKIANESFDPNFGARNVNRYIGDNIENLISRLILEEKVKKGEDFMITLDESGDFTIEK